MWRCPVLVLIVNIVRKRNGERDEENDSKSDGDVDVRKRVEESLAVTMGKKERYWMWMTLPCSILMPCW